MTKDRLVEVLKEFDKWSEYSDADIDKCANAIFNEMEKEIEDLREEVRYSKAVIMEMQDYK